ncbi:MAG: hypothetical protein RR115_00975 [Hydrogenoanaerobacterium sp.]
MLITSVVVCVFLLMGFALIFGLDLSKLLMLAKDPSAIKNKLPRRKQYLSLKNRLDELYGRKRIDFLNRSIMDAKQVLAKTGRAGKIKSTMILCSFCAACGFIISILLKNFFLCPILTIGFYLVPLWVVKITAKNYKKRLSNELSTSLSIITAAYVRNENIIIAVEENLSNLHAPVKEPFAMFIAQIKFISSDVIAALQTLQGSIDNQIFKSWCASLIQCQSDRNLKYTLQPLVNKLSQTKALQAELETDLMKPLKSFAQMAALTLICIPGIYILNKEWFFYLTNTFLGQLSLAIIALLVMSGINKAIDLSQPIENNI